MLLQRLTTLPGLCFSAAFWCGYPAAADGAAAHLGFLYFPGLFCADPVFCRTGSCKSRQRNNSGSGGFFLDKQTVLFYHTIREPSEKNFEGRRISGFSLADVMAGLSICRNPKLANVFYRLDLIEAYGTGLKKIMNAYSGITAETLFQVTENVFKATLPRKTSIGMKLQQSHATNEEKILTLFASSETITRADVEQLTGLSIASASRLLHKMVEGGKLAVTGAGKNTRYYVP